MSALRKFLNSSVGRTCGLIGVLLCVCLLGYVIYRELQQDPTQSLANTPLFIDAETGQTFRKALEVGTTIPVISPFTGRATGYEAEMCYWTRDGKPKAEPTPVLLNETVGKPGPTFCPDCGRLVVHHNPPAAGGRRPPPTQAEHQARHNEPSTATAGEN